MEVDAVVPVVVTPLINVPVATPEIENEKLVLTAAVTVTPGTGSPPVFTVPWYSAAMQAEASIMKNG